MLYIYIYIHVLYKLTYTPYKSAKHREPLLQGPGIEYLHCGDREPREFEFGTTVGGTGAAELETQ